MRKDTDTHGNVLIFCTNHACASNGGKNADAFLDDPLPEKEETEIMSGAKPWTPAQWADWKARHVKTHGMTPGEPAPPPFAVTPNFEPRPTTTEDRLNKTEKSCLLWLRCLKVPGLQIQAVTFLLAADCRFTPDFSWFDENRRWAFGDCKGTRSDGKILIEEDAAIKLRTAARMFPWLRFVKLWVPKGGAWTIVDVQL